MLGVPKLGGGRVDLERLFKPDGWDIFYIFLGELDSDIDQI